MRLHSDRRWLVYIHIHYRVCCGGPDPFGWGRAGTGRRQGVASIYTRELIICIADLIVLAADWI